MEIERKKYYGIVVALLMISLLLAAYSVTINVKAKREIVVNRYTLTDYLDYYVYLKPNFLFNKTILKDSTIYINITKNIVVRYMFFSKSSGSVDGIYKVIAEIKTKEWNKTIVIIPEREFKNSYILNFPIDVYYFRSIYNRINNELGFKGTNPEVVISIKTYVRGRNFSDTFLHTLSFPLLSKAFKISTKHKTSKVRTLKKIVYVVDEGKNSMKIATGILSVLSFLAVGIFCWRVKPIKIEKDLATIMYERNKDFIILGKLEIKDSTVVTVNSFDDLLKTAEILNKPIIKDGKRFGLIDGHTVYVFEFKG